VLRTSNEQGFERQRHQPVEQAIVEFIASVNFSRFNTPETQKILYGWLDQLKAEPLQVFHQAMKQGEHDKGLWDYLINHGKLSVKESYAGHGTLLHIAAANKRSDVVNYLIEQGAEVNAKGVGQRTALHIAAINNDQATLQILLNHKADLSLKDSGSKTACEKAKEKHQQEAIDLLEDYASGKVRVLSEVSKEFPGRARSRAMVLSLTSGSGSESSLGDSVAESVSLSNIIKMKSNSSGITPEAIRRNQVQGRMVEMYRDSLEMLGIDKPFSEVHSFVIDPKKYLVGGVVINKEQIETFLRTTLDIVQPQVKELANNKLGITLPNQESINKMQDLAGEKQREYY